MRAGEVGAARLLHWSEFHEFDAGQVRIVKIELPFAVSADFGFFGELDAVFLQFLFRCVNVGHADSDVIHNSTKPLIGVGFDVDHEFEPVRAVRDLHRNPVGLMVLHSTVPVGAETENVFVEVLRGGAIANDEASMDNRRPKWYWRICAWDFHGWRVRTLQKHQGMIFRIPDRETWVLTAFLELFNRKTVFLQEFSKFSDITCLECNFV